MEQSASLSVERPRKGRSAQIYDNTRQRPTMHAVFFLCLAAGAIFVWWSSGSLPEVVATHFIAGGVPDGFTPRGRFVAFMLAVVLSVPTLVYSMGWLASRLPVRFVNLPNKQYWLTPERRTATLVSLARFGGWAGYSTIALLCVLHGFVVQANAQRPPHLEQAPFVGLMAAYLLALFAGMAAVLGRFFRVP